MKLVGRIGLVLVAVAIVITITWAQTAPPKAVMEFKSPLGTVTFQHKVHIEQHKIACVKCHHTFKAGEPVIACSNCHTKVASGKQLSLKDAVHKTCGDCHKVMIAEGKKPPTPTKCMECHKKPA